MFNFVSFFWWERSTLRGVSYVLGEFYRITASSLGVRLFINLMAGHSLLKVIIGFSWSMLLLENFTSIGLILPMIILVILFGLELGVALIQTYVFIILTCIYIQDGS